MKSVCTLCGSLEYGVQHPDREIERLDKYRGYGFEEVLADELGSQGGAVDALLWVVSESW